MHGMPQTNYLENEPEIVEKAKYDDAYFEILYNHYFPKIYGYIFKRTGNHEIAEDLVSDTFMKVFANLNKYTHQGHTFGAWIYKIATNRLIDHYRKAGRQKEVDIQNIAEPADTRKRPEFLAAQSQDRILIQFVLNKLPEKHQKVLYLKFFNEMSNIEIGEALGTNPNNAGVMIHRALQNFQNIYKKYEK